MPITLRAALLLVLLCTACAGPRIELAEWRAEHATAAASERVSGDLRAELQRVETLRRDQELEAARRLALALAAAHPEDPAALTAASRAESDAMFLFPDDERARNHAAASALDYARAADRRGATQAADRAQLAWALGTSTHLQPMFDRAEHAQRTLEAAEAALLLREDEPTALATLAVVHLRLETLPWIAKTMAWGAPDASLEDAERFARRAVASLPSRENRQILAKVLLAAERSAEAQAELEAALAAPATHPRDQALEPALRKLRESIE